MSLPANGVGAAHRQRHHRPRRRHAVATLTPEQQHRQQQQNGEGSIPPDHHPPLPSIRLDAGDPICPSVAASGRRALAPRVQRNLGRNHLTKIHDTSVSRNLATLTLTIGDAGGGARLSLRPNKKPGEHHMLLNGVRIKADPGGVGVRLTDGDLLSLWGDRYPYRVSLSTTTTTVDDATTGGGNDGGNGAAETAASSSSSTSLWASQPLPAGTVSVPRPASPPQPSDAEKPTRKRRAAGSGGADGDTPPCSPIRRQRSAAARDMVEETTCSVCMDVVVRATAVLPCGHTFCASCLGPQNDNNGKKGGQQRLTLCPNCRGDVAGTVPVRTLDAVVLGMVRRGDFDRDDVEHYLQRSGTNLTEEEMENIIGRTAEREEKRRKLSKSPSSPPDWAERETQNSSNDAPLPSSSEQLSPPKGTGAAAGAKDDDDDEIEVVGVVMNQQPQPQPISGGGQGTNADDAICLD